MKSNLHKKWKDLCHNLGINNLNKINRWFNYLINSYSKDRHYHNLNHIDSMLSNCMVYPFKSYYDIIPLVEFSIWFHDCIYDVKRTENEEKSSEKAQECLRDFKIENEKTFYGTYNNFVKSLILATKHDKEEVLYWNKFITDIDNLILSKDWKYYLNYAKKIRKEYSIYSDEIWKVGRTNFLNNVLDKKRIFYLAEFESLDKVARKNIKKELALLK